MYKNNGLDWTNAHRVSLYNSYSDVSFDSFLKFLRENPQIKKAVMCVPADKDKSTEFMNMYDRVFRYDKNADIKDFINIEFCFMANLPDDMQRYKEIEKSDLPKEKNEDKTAENKDSKNQTLDEEYEDNSHDDELEAE
jgi:hypothetical protein